MFRSLHAMFITDPRDWSVDRYDAWYYGVLVGWDCEKPGCAHDDQVWCGGDRAMQSLAAQHGWTPGAVARLRAMRRAAAEATKYPPHPAPRDTPLRGA